MVETYITTAVIDVIVLFILSGFLHGNFILADYRKKPFIFGIIITVLVIAAEAGTVLAGNDGSQLRLLNVFFNSVGFAIAPLIPIALIAIFNVQILTK